MKISRTALLLTISTIALSQGQVTRAPGPGPIYIDAVYADAAVDDEVIEENVAKDAEPDYHDAGTECAAGDCSNPDIEEIPVETEEYTENEAASDEDAGKECVAGDCANPDDVAGDRIAETETSEDKVEETKEDTPDASKEEESDDSSCPSRPHVIRCAAKYLDTNHNGMLEREELESAMESVPWLLRSLLRIIGSVDVIMTKCDADGDGVITIEHDMEATKETCLATCFKRYAFKRLFFPDCTE